MELDWVIRSIMESVKALGIMKDTIIVFSSDNGAASVEQCGPNAANVSKTLSWPGTVQPSQSNNDVIGLMDLSTTGLHLAGIPIPSDRFVDGRNLFDLAKYGRKSSPTGTHFFYRGDMLGAVRHGDYKVISYREL
jgi:arylsulfatase A-like enzyme